MHVQNAQTWGLQGFCLGFDLSLKIDKLLRDNAPICLINQTNVLLDQKLRWLEEKFVNEGGFRENLFKKRMEKRKTYLH